MIVDSICSMGTPTDDSGDRRWSEVKIMALDVNEADLAKLVM